MLSGAQTMPFLGPPLKLSETFGKGTNPTPEGSTLMAFPPADTILLRVRISALNLQGCNIQPMANPFYSVSVKYSTALLITAFLCFSAEFLLHEACREFYLIFLSFLFSFLSPTGRTREITLPSRSYTPYTRVLELTSKKTLT